MKKGLEVLVFLVFLPFVFFHLRSFAIAGGDTDWIVALVERPLYFFFRAPLVVAFHKGLWVVLRNFGWTAGDCVSLSSSMAGGFFYLALYRISSDWKVWFPFLIGSLPWVFFGHQETYAWPFALTLWTFHLLGEYLANRVGAFPLFATLVLATFAHPMVFMIWPGVFWSLRPWSRERLKPFLLSAVLVLALLVLFLSFGEAGGFPQRKWILPLFDVGNSLTRYSVFSWQHWKELGWFYLISMPVGSILLFRHGMNGWHGWIGGLHLTVVVTLFWSLFWHPGMSYSDWDLFSWPALFVNLAGGLSWSRRKTFPAEAED